MEIEPKGQKIDETDTQLAVGDTFYISCPETGEPMEAVFNGYFQLDEDGSLWGIKYTLSGQMAPYHDINWGGIQ